MGLSIGLDTAVKALRAHQLAVDVASHNIANAQTPGYSRQRVLLRPIGLDGSDHFSRDNLLGRPGFGVDAKDVNRVRDMFLDLQARQSLSSQGQFKALSTPLANAEVVFNDPSDDGISALLGKFWAAWHDVVNEPESSAARTALVHATTTFTKRVNAAYDQLTLQRQDLNHTVKGIAGQINAKATELASLNLQVKQVELNGDMANDLRDRRDLLLDELSSLANISYSEDDTGSLTVYLGTHELVVGTAARTINAVDDPSNTGMLALRFAIDGDAVNVSSGQLRGVLDARDVALPDLLRKLDTFANGLMNSVNSIHQQGYGLNGITGLQFFTGTGAKDFAINAALATTPHSIAAATGPNQPGNPANALAIANLQTAANMLSGFSADNLVLNESLSAGVTASALTLGGTLQPGAYHIVAAGPNLELRYGSATGPIVGTAALANINPPGGTIQFMNGANVAASISVTTAAPYSAAQQQTDLTAAGNSVLQVEAAPSTFYANIVSVLGADVNRAQGLEESSGLLADHLEGLRQSVQGVSIDEEVTALNAAQHAYNAAAKVISTIDEMLDTLINRTGVG